MKIENIEIGKIGAYAKNAKVHSKKQIQQVANSIKRFGFVQPIVVDKNNEIVIGHCRFEASKTLDLKEVPCLKVENLSDKEISALRLADNKLNESNWDMNLVIDDLKGLDLDLLDLTGFDKDLLIEPDEKDDVVPENVPSRSKLGDLYELGQHRLQCADSCDSGAVSALCGGNRAQMCFCDPPYNVDYAGGTNVRGTDKERKIDNDSMSKEAFKEFLLKAMKCVVENTDGGIYVCMSSSELDSLREGFEKAGGHWQSFIIWVKSNFTMSRADYQNTYEPILYGWRDGIVNHYFTQRRDIANVWEDLSKVKTEYDGKDTTITFQGFKVKIQGKVEKGEVIRKKQHTDIWRHDKPIASKLHPTMKPVSLVVEAITNSSSAGDIVLDTFGGGGSTLIACEKTGRICYTQELDPKYVDVIVQRYVDYTGIEEVKLNGETIHWAKSIVKTIK